jgi:hypothetical protein
MQPAEKTSLYDRLGGVYSIATVVDDFINRIMIDPRLNANPLVDEAHHRVPPAGFKYLVTEMVCWATGGPQKYTGKPMAESHKDLKITRRDPELKRFYHRKLNQKGFGKASVAVARKLGSGCGSCCGIRLSTLNSRTLPRRRTNCASFFRCCSHLRHPNLLSPFTFINSVLPTKHPQPSQAQAQ